MRDEILLRLKSPHLQAYFFTSAFILRFYCGLIPASRMTLDQRCNSVETRWRISPGVLARAAPPICSSLEETSAVLSERSSSACSRVTAARVAPAVVASPIHGPRLRGLPSRAAAHTRRAWP